MSTSITSPFIYSSLDSQSGILDMALSQTVVRISGGIIVALFNYQSDMDLYRLTITEGTANVIRDGTAITIDKTDGKKSFPHDSFAEMPIFSHLSITILKWFQVTLCVYLQVMQTLTWQSFNQNTS